MHRLAVLVGLAAGLPLSAQEVNSNAPAITAVNGIDRRVQVAFSLPVQLATATNAGNYSLSNLYGTVSVLAAAPGTNSQTIQLTTARQLPFMQHWLTVNGVADALTGTNYIAPNSQASYTNIAFTTGYIKSEFYLGIAGTTLASLTNNARFPNSPSRISYPTDSYWFDSTVGANYGNRMSGILVPPETGPYVFIIYTPGAGLLSLSTNEDPAFKRTIASCQNQIYTQSAAIPLVAGEHYYFEALSKEGSPASDFSELVWMTPQFSNSISLIPTENTGNYLSDPAATIRILHQPSDASVYDSRRATFAIDALGFSRVSTNLNYQWQLNGEDIPGATQAAYTTAPLFETNSGGSYRVLTYLPGAALFSTSASLTVTQDLVPPTVLQSLNFGNTNLQLLFSEELDLATAMDPGNYVFTGGPIVTGVSLDQSATVVTLTTSPLVYGTPYSLVMNGIKDQALIANTIASNTTIAITVTGPKSQDIGNPPLPGVTTTRPDGVDIAACGQDIGGTADQFNLNYQVCAGDFDVCVRVAGLSVSDVWARAGLMARETLSAGSRFAAVLATPSLNGGNFEYRDHTNAVALTSGSFPVNYPDTWMRLQRFGDYILGYASYDGHTWASIGGGFFTNLPPVVYVGLAVSSHDVNQRTLAQFRDLHLVSPDAVTGPLENPREPLGPSSRKSPITISEIMYKPAPRSDGNNTEFLELYNSNPWFHDISGYRIVGNNMSYTVPARTVMPGGSFLVLAASPQSMRTLYGITNVIGPYAGTLQVPDKISLYDEHGALLLTVPYSDISPWPVAANGSGHSIILAKPSYGEEDPRAWDISDLNTGSPGTADAFHPDPLRDVRINELLAHSESANVSDFIELYNHGNRTNDLSGCILTDDPILKKFVVSAGTLLPPAGFIGFDRNQLGFGLSTEGETVYLLSPDGRRILDAVQYEAQADRVSFGRYPDGADALYPLASRTPGQANSPILIRDIVINELMYDPISGNDDDQYIELYNQGTNLVSLAGWQFTSGITFLFPTNAVLAPGGYLVVARDRTNLFAKYPNLNDNNTLGDLTGKLSHNGERVALAMPQAVNGTNTIYVVEDEVTYGVGGRWGQWSAQGGSSLELVDPRADHRLAANWADSDETRKSAWVNIEATGALDNGRNFNSSFAYAQLGPLDAGECLIDNVEIIPPGTTVNVVRNPGFESGLTDWSIQGCMTRSSIENSGYGGSGHSLHVRCSSRVWTGANSCQVALNPGLGAGQTATMRFKARWLRGWPEVLLRLNGNWFEAVGKMEVPSNLGTPGARNSRALSNNGPALYDVTHSPAVPTYGQDVVVSARVHDPDGLRSVVLDYRLDPDTSYTKVAMNDEGTGGDAVARDGVFSATIPGTYGLVAYYISATDNRLASSRFPALLDDNSPVRECAVMFGDQDSGGSFATYHLWLTQSNIDRWNSLPNLSNEMIDGTFVSGSRVIYNMSARYAGSPYHQGFYDPQYSACHFKFLFPDDDKFLGATSFNKIHAPGNGPGDDASLQREQTAYTFMRALGVPWLNRRYVYLYVNTYRSMPLMEDTQCPDADMVKEYFPNDSNGFLYKMQPWFEFAPFPSGNYIDFNNAAWCTIVPYNTTGRVKKTARYRYNFEVRRTPDSANNFTNVFSLIDAANGPASPNYAATVESLADMENWMRVFAANHAAGNWDSFGTQNGQNLYGYIGTQGTRYSLLMFDFNIVLGNSGSWGPGANLYTVNSSDSTLSRLYNTPIFRRMYVRALSELVKGPLDVANTGPIIDAKYNTFAANGLNVENTTAIKSWLNSARASINSQIIGLVNASFTLNSAPQVLDNAATLNGSAPVGVKTILINGVEWPVTWTGILTWTATVPLRPGTNVFSVVGVDMHGQPVEGASGIASAVYDGTPPAPQGQVVFNEIMYAPATPDGEFLELFNASTNTTFDLSGWQIPAVSYIFPEGSLLGPGKYLVLARNRTAFAGKYGATVPIFDTFTVPPPVDGRPLALVRPVSNNAFEVVTEVRYETVAPWPSEANGAGSSLQLLDATRDNWRVGNWAVSASGASSSPGALNTVRTNLPGFAPLLLNEMQADNVTGIKTSAGNPAPWVELYNSSTNPVPLDGLFLSPDYSDLIQWAFPTGAVVSPLSFKLVFCDGQTNLSTSSELHANFTLASNSGELALSTMDTNAIPRVADYINYSNIPPDHSFGSIPNGQGITRVEFLNPTPGTSNFNAATGLTVAINEWMAGNTHTLKDPVTGKYEDWFELYNYGDAPVNLAGCYLSHSLTNKSEFLIPTGYSIASHGFLLAWADKESTIATPDLHVNFKLSKSGTSICLRSPDGALLDYVTFGPQTSDIGMGRYPDGSANIALLPTATPGNVNAPPNTAPALRVSGNKFIYLGQTLAFAAQAEDEDLPRQTLTYSLDPGSPTNAFVDPVTGMFSWTPSEKQAPSTNFFILRVTDNGLPPMSATEAFAVSVSLPPAIAASASPGNPVTLSWTALPGVTYQLQYKADLAMPEWSSLGPPFTGTGDVVSISPTNDVVGAGQAFYRLKVVP